MGIIACKYCGKAKVAGCVCNNKKCPGPPSPYKTKEDFVKGWNE